MKREELWQTIALGVSDDGETPAYGLGNAVRRKGERGIHTTVLNAANGPPLLAPTRAAASKRLPREARALKGLTNYEEPVEIEVAAEDLRFMAMTPGGENPRPEIDPARCHVGVRVKRTSSSRQAIRSFRARFYPLETMEVIGVRQPSDHNRNAFGARHFQPHITLIRPNNGLNRDLNAIGTAFRAAVPGIKFDRFVVRCRTNTSYN
ncbi:hypothetical protein [Bradyrhizobium sp. Ec3.3]|uniref:hypothetical protein n=1 Tax=Bradyrhizobium sp. Ec3.3 TaxID=189753 RepID=UPI0012EC84FE|nr:hypothetical protein [Bradyrhizobium sp. Ec3.3]